MGKTSIEWASDSRNYYTWDCTRVSPGCKHCYMLAMAKQYGKPITGRPQWRANVRKEKIKPGAVYFANSMSDTYHERVPVMWLHRIHNEAMMHPEATFLILTKRIERVYYLRDTLAWPKNLWIGASVENADYLWRLDYLLRIPAAGHFVSVGPMLGPVPGLADYLRPAVDQPLFLSSPTRRAGLGWVIVEAESGEKRRPFDKAWAREVRDLCMAHGVPFMFKQGSAFRPGKDRLLDGRTWDQSPFHIDPTDSHYRMLPEHHALRRYFETHEMGAYPFERVRCEAAIRDYGARLAKVEQRIYAATVEWPPRIKAVNDLLRGLMTPKSPPKGRSVLRPYSSMRGDGECETAEGEGFAALQRQIQIRRLSEELVGLNAAFKGELKDAALDRARLLAEQAAWQVRLRLAGQAEIREAA